MPLGKLAALAVAAIAETPAAGGHEVREAGLSPPIRKSRTAVKFLRTLMNSARSRSATSRVSRPAIDRAGVCAAGSLT
jgi:hypothetical protein